MSEQTPALFAVDGARVVPTAHTRGPWDHGLQHGGPVGGILGLLADDAVAAADRADESTASLTLTRLTVELLRPAPVAPLETEASVDRIGRKAAVASSRLILDGRTVARATGQWVRPTSPTGPAGAPDPNPGDPPPGESAAGERPAGERPPPRPSEAVDPGAAGLGYPRPGFNCDAFELRPVSGDTETPGPGTMWVRMKVALVAGRPVEPVHLLATAADLANAVGWEPSARGEPMINPDLTLQVFRHPISEWLCLRARARIGLDGVGMMETSLWDARGPIGQVLSTMVENTGASVQGVTMPSRPDTPGRG